ncbi:hypothetical protein [Actinopolymorpha pittospori]
MRSGQARWLRRPRAFRCGGVGRLSARTTLVCLTVLFGLLASACADASRLQQSFEPAPMEADGPDGPATAESRALPTVPPSAPPMQPSNPSFEEPLAGTCPARWACETSGAASATLSSEVAHGGNHALQVSVPNERDVYTLRSARMPAKPQRTYVATVWRRSSSAAAGGESVRLLFYDAQNKLVGSQSEREGEPEPWAWGGVSAKADAPMGTRSVAIEITVQGPGRTVWLDGVKARDSPILEVWGGTGVRRGKSSDTLTLQVTTPTPGGVHIGTIDAFGQHLAVRGSTRLESQDGDRLAYALAGSAKYQADTKTIVVPPGQPATIHITGGRFTPTPGTGFPRATLGDPVAGASFPVFVAAQNFSDGSSGAFELPDRQAILTAVDQLGKYLDGRRLPDGGWAIAHPYWPGQLREDPQAIAVITQGYLYRAQSSSDATYEARARQGLEWLVKNQHGDGGFGLPWPFGAHTGHFNTRLHYPGGADSHRAGDPLAVVTIAAGSALLDGFKVYGDSRYLAASARAMNYLLHGPNGFQWLDADHTRGSIPYCDLRPVLEPDDPRVAAHAVLPAVRNSSVEIYNIDGAALSFLKGLYVETGDKRLLTYGDAIAANLATKVRDDGSIPYSWYEPSPHSGGYANISYTGLFEYGGMRGRDDWVATAGRGFSWMANHARTGMVPTEGYASVYGLNLSLDVSRYVSRTLVKQKADGSFTGGTATRTDAVVFGILSNLLLNMGG